MTFSTLGKIVDIYVKQETNMFRLFRKSHDEFKVEPLETCISCDSLIVDNPCYEISFKNEIHDTITVYAHYSVGRKGCYNLEDIKKKLSYSTYLATGIKYRMDKSKKI